jgi:tetratricopeptide (TPR) repeat protein
MSLFRELKRRNVVRMALFYLVGAWVVLQVTDVVVGVVGLPDWTLRLVGLVLLLGLPLVLVLSWVYQLTPEGLKKETSIDETGQKVTVTPAQRLIMIASFALVIVGGYGLIERFMVKQQEAAREQAVAKTVAVNPDEQPRTKPVIIAVAPVTVHADGDVPDGMLEQWRWLIDFRLDYFWGLRVIPRERVAALATESETDAALADALGATHLLKTTLWVSGDEGQFDLRIFDASAGRDTWSMSFSDPLLVGDEIEIPVMIDLDLELDRFLAEAGLAERFIKTESKLAYEAWYMARHFDGFEDPDTEQLRWYNEAIMLDPEYAQAHADLARYWFIKTNRGIPWSEVRKAAFAAAERALELDPNHAETHANLGRMYQLDARHAGQVEADFEAAADLRRKGLEHAKKAVQLAPKDTSIREDYVRALWDQGEWEEIINQLEISYRYTPDILYMRDWKITPLVWLRRVDEAEAYLEDLKQEFPQVDWGHTEAAFVVHRARGEFREALAAIYPQIRSGPNSWLMDYMDLLFDIGALESVERWGRYISELNNGEGVNFAWTWIASSLMHLGKYESAVTFLDGLSDGVVNQDTRVRWEMNADYQKVMHGSIDDPSLADELDRLRSFCESFYSPSGAGASSAVPPEDLTPAINCFVLSTRLGPGQAALGQRILRHFAERDPVRVEPPGMRNTFDVSSLNLVYALGAMGEVERAVEVLKELVDQGFSLPFHFRTYNVVPDLEGIYNGLGSHPEFLEIVDQLKARNAVIRADIQAEAPWLLDPTLDPPKLEEP